MKALYWVIRGGGWYWIEGAVLPCWSPTIRNATHYPSERTARIAAHRYGCTVVRVVARRPRQVHSLHVGAFTIAIKAPSYEEAYGAAQQRLQKLLGSPL